MLDDTVLCCVYIILYWQKNIKIFIHSLCPIHINVSLTPLCYSKCLFWDLKHGGLTNLRVSHDQYSQYKSFNWNVLHCMQYKWMQAWHKWKLAVILKSATLYWLTRWKCDHKKGEGCDFHERNTYLKCMLWNGCHKG